MKKLILLLWLLAATATGQVFRINVGGTGNTTYPTGSVIYYNGTKFMGLPLGDVGTCLLVATGPTLAWGACGTGGGTTSPLTTKGDIWVYGPTDTRLPVGTDDYVLTADSTATEGIAWKPPPGAGSTPLTTKGDLFGFTTVNARVPVGADGLFLMADSGQATGLNWGVPNAARYELSTTAANGVTSTFSFPVAVTSVTTVFVGGIAQTPSDISISGGNIVLGANIAPPPAGVEVSALYNGAIGGGGSVTSVGASGPSGLLTWSGSPVTSSGTLTASLNTQNANKCFCGPTSGGDAAPTFRLHVPADNPPSAGGTGANNTATSGRYLKGDGTNFVTSSGSASGVGNCTSPQVVTGLSSDAAPTCHQLTGSDVNGVSIVDVQTFTSNGTWNKPAGVTIVLVEAIGGGGGGGGGGLGCNCGGNTTTADSGGGGGAGAYNRRYYLASELGSTVSVTVPAAAAGGAAILMGGAPPYSTPGNSGGNGGAACFGSGFCVGGGSGGSPSGFNGVGGGGGGTFGSAVSGIAGGNPNVFGTGDVNIGGAGGNATSNGGGSAEYGGGAGGQYNTNRQGGSSIFSAGGGGGGGSVSAVHVVGEGSDGGTTNSWTRGGGALHRNQDANGDGINGDNGTTVAQIIGSGGGGGGGAQMTGAANRHAGDGGNGGNYGAGGGGGGACAWYNAGGVCTSGKGGDGATGYVRVTSW